MKIDQILVQHFYNSKKLSLQGIGNFTLNYNVDNTLTGEKDIEIPPGAIEFTFDSKAGEDEELIKFIVEKTRKIKPLAAADLDSFLTLGKQFLNIGKPFRLEGIGTLQKGQGGNYEFVPGVFIAPRLEAGPAVLKEKIYDEVSFNNEGKKGGINKKALLLGGVFALLLAGAAVTWWVFNKNNNGSSEVAGNGATKDTGAVNKKDTGTAKMGADTSNKGIGAVTPLPAPGADGYTFKVVFKEGAKEVVEQRMRQLQEWNYKNLVMAAKDSTTYRLMMPFNNPVTDTARVLDSIKTLFGNKGSYIIF